MTEAQPIAGRAADPRSASVAQRATWRTEMRTFLFDVLHLVVLSSFAVAWPLFEVLAEGASFFAVRGSPASEVLVFAAIVTVGPAMAFATTELVARVITGEISRVALHFVFVAFLVALIALQTLKDSGLESDRALFGGAGALGLLAALLYMRWRPARSILSVLAPAPLIFLALFLFNSSVSRLVLPGEAEAATTRVSSSTPVVIVVFDEFTGASLMDADLNIDAKRFPNFAALARTSTWFRNAASVNLSTVRALPAILTGKYAPPRSLPIYRDHPNNLFTLLGDHYDLNVREVETHLCPPRLCPTATQTGVDRGFDSLLLDVSVVFGHVVLPRSLAERLPSISTSWGNFLGRDVDFHLVGGHRTAAFNEFLNSLAQNSRPELHFLHLELPHFPWEYLPSEKRYPATGGHFPGLEGEAWGQDPWLVLQAEQRYLLQVGYVDRLLGRLIARLRATGLFDRAVLIITADHGVSFHVGEGRRTTVVHREDLALVPLFVKAPAQRTGRTVDRVVESVDIMPAVAELLGVTIPWRVDGRSLLVGPGRRTIRNEDRTFDAAMLVRRRDASAAQRVRTFGIGWLGTFRAGPRPGLVGTLVETLTRLPAASLRANLNEADQFRVLDPAGSVVPSFVAGALTGNEAGSGIDVAVAINGRIEGVGRSYERAGAVLFGAMVPDWAYKPGANTVEVFAVTDRAGSPALRSLARLGNQDAITFRLERREGMRRIVSSAGKTIRIVPGSVGGYVDSVKVRDEQVNFVGWAADTSSRRIRDQVLVFVNGRFLYSFRTVFPGGRPDLPRGLASAGFNFTLPLNLVASGEHPKVEVFGVIGDRASELAYPPDYPWGSKAITGAG